MSRVGVKQPADRQVIGDTADTPHWRLKRGGGHSNQVLTVGEVLYRLTGLLMLQRLYADVVAEKRRLEAHLAKQELLYQVKDQLTSRDKCSSSIVEEDVGAVSNMDSESQTDGNNSLFSPLYRSMHLQLAKYEQKMVDIEGKTAQGLIKENYELKQSYQHQQKVVEELERELELYRQIRRSPSDPASSSFNDEEIVRKLSESDKLLSIQRTLTRELGVQLEQRSREVDMVQERLDLEQFGRRRAQAQINSILNDFVLCCLQIPEVAHDINVKQAFDELLLKSETLCEFDVDIAAAVHLALEDSSRTDFLRSAPSEAGGNVTDISLDQALEKISNLLANEQRLRREAKHQVIEQMRKHKHATMKVKDLEERLKKCDAEKRLIEEHLRDEIRKLCSKLDALERTFGHRSSYAAKAAQSVRSLIELIEEQKMELEYQRDCLSSELAVLQRSQDELKSRNEQLEADINRLNVTALEEATARVRGTLGGLESQCDSLRNENKTLQEQLDVLQETLKRDRDIHRSTVETMYRLEQQVQAQQTELRELKAINASLVASKQQMEDKINAPNSERIRREMSLRQSVEPRQGSMQRSSGGVSYLARELTEPELIPRSSPLSMSPRSELERLGPTVPRKEDIMTQSLPPAINLYSQSPHPGDPNQANYSAVRYQSLSSRTGGIEPSKLSDAVVGGSSGRDMLYPRTSLLGPLTRDTMQCLRCGSRFPITNLDGYEKHIKECYSDIQ